MSKSVSVTAVILAGGRARRMGGVDKGLVEMNGQPMITQVIQRIKPQTDHILINANRNIAEYEKLGYPVISDSLSDFQGPLAGFLAAMQSCDTDYIATLPCDGPLLPTDMIERMVTGLSQNRNPIAVAHDGQRLQPVHALISCGLEQSLLQFLQAGDRKIDLWYAQHNYSTTDFSDSPETFLNINTLEERDHFEKRHFS